MHDFRTGHVSSRLGYRATGMAKTTVRKMTTLHTKVMYVAWWCAQASAHWKGAWLEPSSTLKHVCRKAFRFLAFLVSLGSVGWFIHLWCWISKAIRFLSYLQTTLISSQALFHPACPPVYQREYFEYCLLFMQRKSCFDASIIGKESLQRRLILFIHYYDKSYIVIENVRHFTL